VPVVDLRGFLLFPYNNVSTFLAQRIENVPLLQVLLFLLSQLKSEVSHHSVVTAFFFSHRIAQLSELVFFLGQLSFLL
jgi:hypothetical protein